MKDCFPHRLSVNRQPRQACAAIVLALIGWTLAGWAPSGWAIRGPGTAAAAEPPAASERPAAIVLKHDSLTESSGVALSHRRADRIWTHNDSGDAARLFAFDTAGRSTGVWSLATARAVDWEDIASFEIDGRPRLLVADVGDNDARRSEVQLYLFDEPDPDRSGNIQRVETIRVRFPDGPCDCEAVAVDVATKQIWLASKRRLPICDLFVVPLAAAPQPVTARRIARVAVPMVTGMDISADSQSLVLGGYFDAFVYRKKDATESWAAALRRTPQHYVMPPLKQIEAVCFDGDQHVWVTSEGRPSKMVKLRIP